MKTIKLVKDIDLNEVFGLLSHPEAGGMDIFVGTVRNHAHGKEVVRLDFEGYEAMALKEMDRIADQALQKWPIMKLVMIHVLGPKQIGQPVVVIGTATAHREDAFTSCRYLIDTLKDTVPIWKKEYFEDKTVWVNAHP